MGDLPLYHNREEILSKAKNANGHKIGDFNINKREVGVGNKGVIGQIIEEGVFGYPVNNRAEPDFAKLGVELKVTGLKELKNHSFVAKERLILNVIDFFKEADTDFEHSSFWNKNQNLLLMFYLYVEGVSPEEYKIIDSILYKYPIEDLKIIKDDWEFINRKINEGKAHLLSEADTMYLAACTKGANGEAVRLQPYSKIMAKQRAFCLKNSYLNQIIKNSFIDEKCEKMMTVDEIRHATFEMAVQSTVKKYIGKSETELRNLFGIESSCKNAFERIAAKILDINGKLNKSDEFLKANILGKTIRVEEDGHIVESMSFPTFDFIEIANESWEDSGLRNSFFETKFLFFVFKKKNGEYRFEGVKFWNMPVEILDSKVYDVWAKTKEIILSGNIVAGIKPLKNGKSIMQTNFPGMSFNGVCHVRPHAQNAEDTNPLPVIEQTTGQTTFTKQCFWLNNSFIRKIIE